MAVQGGQESGVEECIMRYHQESFYETSKGRVQWEDPDGSLQRGAKYPPMELAGTIFCDDDKGTGVNAPHRRGESEGGQRLQREM